VEEIQESYYAIIPANVRYDKNLKANEKLLYGEITALANKKGYCWASNQYFAELYGVSKETISRWISKLAKSGYVEVEIKYKEGTKEVDQRNIWIEKREVMTKTSRGHDKNVNTPIDENVKENNTVINNTLNNKKNNNKKKEKVIEYDLLINAYTNNEKLKNTLYDFIKMRKAIKAVLTTRALEIMINNLNKLAHTDNEKIEILEQSIINSWRGIFPLKKEGNYGNGVRGTKQDIGEGKYDFVKVNQPIGKREGWEDNDMPM